MAFKHGSKAEVFYGNFPVGQFMRSAELSATLETADTTTFGATWRTGVAGLLSAGYEFEGLYDPAYDAYFMSALTDVQVLTVCPSGSALGAAARLMPVLSSSFGNSSTIDDAVAFSLGVTASGALAFGQILHPYALDTNTTTGAEKDDASATATGWTAHLHVSGVTGGSWVVKLQDAAVSNTYSDVSGGAFSAVTGSASERLLSASGTTALRRYVRYVATRTGGTAGDGIAFALAYSRTRQ